MFARLLLLFYFCIFMVVADGPQSLKTAKDEAYVAYNDLYKMSTNGYFAVISVAQSQSMQASQVMSDLEKDLTETVNSKLNLTIDNIQEIQDILRGSNATSCNYDYPALIEIMRIPLLNRITECVSLYKDVYEGLYNRVNAEASMLFYNVPKCHLQSLTACANYSKNDDCYNFLISNFKKASDVIIQTSNFMMQAVKIKFYSIKPPCKELINFEISVWPDYYLQALNSCAEKEFWNARQTTVCPYDISSLK